MRPAAAVAPPSTSMPCFQGQGQRVRDVVVILDDEDAFARDCRLLVSPGRLVGVCLPAEAGSQ
jgi:hypothetical protein